MDSAFLWVWAGSCAVPTNRLPGFSDRGCGTRNQKKYYSIILFNIRYLIKYAVVHVAIVLLAGISSRSPPLLCLSIHMKCARLSRSELVRVQIKLSLNRVSYGSAVSLVVTLCNTEVHQIRVGQTIRVCIDFLSLPPSWLSVSRTSPGCVPIHISELIYSLPQVWLFFWSWSRGC